MYRSVSIREGASARDSPPPLPHEGEATLPESPAPPLPEDPYSTDPPPPSHAADFMAAGLAGGGGVAGAESSSTPAVDRRREYSSQPGPAESDSSQVLETPPEQVCSPPTSLCAIAK